MKYRYLSCAVLLAAALSAQGCGAILVRIFETEKGPYCGVRSDFANLSDVEQMSQMRTIDAVLLVPFMLVDLPLSGVVDTVLLPLDLYNMATAPCVNGCKARLVP